MVAVGATGLVNAHGLMPGPATENQALVDSHASAEVEG